MQIKIFIILFCFLLPSIHAQVNDDRVLLQPHIEKIAQAFPLLEKELKNCILQRQRYARHCLTLEQKLNQSNSLFGSVKIKIQLALYRHQEKKYQKKQRKKQLQNSIYCLLLWSFQRKNFSPTQLQKAKRQKFAIANRQRWAVKNKKLAKDRWCKASKRLIEIPQEKRMIEQNLVQAHKKLRVLSYKKSWSNFQERFRLHSKITLLQAKKLKLEGELLLQKKIKQDAEEEAESMRLEEAEARLALLAIYRCQ